MSETGLRFLKIAAICGVAGPLIMLASDLFVLATERRFEWSIGMWAACMLFIPAVFGLAYCLAAAGSRLAYLAGALAFFGITAGASMQVLFRVHAVLAEQGATAVVDQLRNTFKLVASTQMIGLGWPLGLFFFAISNVMVDRDRWLISVLLVVAAITFPIGRIAGSEAAVIISGVALVVVFGLIARLLVSKETRFE